MFDNHGVRDMRVSHADVHIRPMESIPMNDSTILRILSAGAGAAFIALGIASAYGQPLAQLPMPPGSLLPLPPGYIEPAPVIVDKPTAKYTYADAHAEAIQEGKRLALFVGTPARHIDGVISYSVPWDGEFKKAYPNKSLVICSNYGKHDKLYVLGIVSPSTSDQEIKTGGMSEAVLLEKTVERRLPPMMAQPFLAAPRRAAAACST